MKQLHWRRWVLHWRMCVLDGCGVELLHWACKLAGVCKSRDRKNNKCRTLLDEVISHGSVISISTNTLHVCWNRTPKWMDGRQRQPGSHYPSGRLQKNKRRWLEWSMQQSWRRQYEVMVSSMWLPMVKCRHCCTDPGEYMDTDFLALPAKRA